MQGRISDEMDRIVDNVWFIFGVFMVISLIAVLLFWTGISFYMIFSVAFDFIIIDNNFIKLGMFIYEFILIGVFLLFAILLFFSFVYAIIYLIINKI